MPKNVFPPECLKFHYSYGLVASPRYHFYQAAIIPASVEALRSDFAGVDPHLTAKWSIINKQSQSLNQGSRIVGRHDPTRLAMRHRFRQGSNSGRDDRQTLGHRFEHGQRQTVAACRKNKEVRLGKQFHQLG